MTERIPMQRGVWKAMQSMGSQRVGHDWATKRATKPWRYYCADYKNCGSTLQSFADYKTAKFLKRQEYQTTLPSSWETYMPVKNQYLELNTKQWMGSKLGEEYIKAANCYLAYLAFMQSTSHEIQGWINHKLELRLLGEISITSAR